MLYTLHCYRLRGRFLIRPILTIALHSPKPHILRHTSSWIDIPNPRLKSRTPRSLPAQEPPNILISIRRRIRQTSCRISVSSYMPGNSALRRSLGRVSYTVPWSRRCRPERVVDFEQFIRVGRGLWLLYGCGLNWGYGEEYADQIGSIPVQSTG